jgi:hypothetical protein
MSTPPDAAWWPLRFMQHNPPHSYLVATLELSKPYSPRIETIRVYDDGPTAYQGQYEITWAGSETFVSTLIEVRAVLMDLISERGPVHVKHIT